MLYLSLKALHVTAAVILAGGVLLNLVVLAALLAISPLDEREARFLQAIRAWDRRITTPALVSVWILGLCLAISGEWFSSSWLHAKLPLVLILSGLHGVSSGRLLRATTSLPASPVWRYLPAAAILLLLGVVFLAVAKPF